jgi:hypothetical protein
MLYPIVILLGGSGVGKTSILYRSKGREMDWQSPTIGAAFESLTLHISPHDITNARIQLRDEVNDYAETRAAMSSRIKNTNARRTTTTTTTSGSGHGDDEKKTNSLAAHGLSHVRLSSAPSAMALLPYDSDAAQHDFRTDRFGDVKLQIWYACTIPCCHSCVLHNNDTLHV